MSVVRKGAEARAKPNKQDSYVTPAHLLETVLHNSKHTKQHINRVTAKDVINDKRSIKFNADHAQGHIEDLQDHAERLAKALKKNDSSARVFRSEAKALKGNI